MNTQLQKAKAGEITEQVKAVAENESLDADFVRNEVAEGRVVIPANKNHIKSNLQPVGIGRSLRTKVNANIGASSAASGLDKEIEKLDAAIEAGADAVMDLSTGGNLDDIRVKLLSRCTVPFGTVPIYQVIEGRGVEDVTNDLIMQVLTKQAKQGVDFFTIHAGLLREHLPLTVKRTGGIVSRGGALLAKWMLEHKRQNPLYEMFDDICDIMLQYDVAFSLGDGLRPGCIADATDDAQLAELKVMAELAERARSKGCQVMIEGPGHVPFNEIQYNMEIQQKICKDAPFYVLGPVVTDIAPGYDHITAAIGGTAAAYYGASFLCYVTPREHLGLPNTDDVREGVAASKIAAHAADVARKLKGVDKRDKQLSKARAELDWETHINLSLDSKKAQKMHEETCREMGLQELPSADYCSMCGKEWCSIRINRQVREAMENNNS
jgi:phosphomethylpyrimidine synthase